MNKTSIVSEGTPTEKAAEITYLLMEGEQFTTAQVAERFGMSWHGAERMLNKASRRIPIYKDNRHWRKM